MKRLYKILAPLAIVSVVLFALPKGAFASVSSDNAATWVGCDASGTQTTSYTMGAGANGILVVATPNAFSVASVSYGGVAMVHLATSTVANEYSYYYLQNPPTGANTLSITNNGTETDLNCSIASFFGAQQTGNPFTGHTGFSVSGTSISENFTTSSAGSMVVDFVATNGSPIAPISSITPTGTGHVSATYFYSGGGDQEGGGIGYTPAASVSTYTIGYSASNSSTPWGVDYYELLPAAPPSTPRPVVQISSPLTIKGGTLTIK